MVGNFAENVFLGEGTSKGTLELCEDYISALREGSGNNQGEATKRKNEDNHEASISLKRVKIEENVESISDHDEIAILKRRMKDLETENKTLKNKLSLLNRKVECSECHEVPRILPVPVCPNGHVVCSRCFRKKSSCSACRSSLGHNTSLIAAEVIKMMEQKCKFEKCNGEFLLHDLEAHEKVCLHRFVGCPVKSCDLKFPLSKLVDHLTSETSSCCTNDIPEPVEVDENEFHEITYFFDDEADVYLEPKSWTANIYEIWGTHLIIVANKDNGMTCFSVAMLATDSECSKYKVELLVHADGTDASDPDTEISSTFTGSPLSIDEKKESLICSAVGIKVIEGLLKKSENMAFILSFRLVKKKCEAKTEIKEEQLN